MGEAFPLQFGGFFLTPTRGLKARLVNETHPGVPLRPGRMEGLLCHHSPGSDVSWHGSALCPDYGEGRCEALDGSGATALPPSPGHVFPPPRALHWHSWLLRGAELNKNTPAPFPPRPKTLWVLSLPCCVCRVRGGIVVPSQGPAGDAQGQINLKWRLGINPGSSKHPELWILAD